METEKNDKLKLDTLSENSHLPNTSNPQTSVKSENDTQNLHVEIERNGGNFGAFFNIVCAVGGAGVLGLPYATMQGGWAVLIFVILAAFVSHTTGVQTIECLYYKNKDYKNKNIDRKQLDKNRLNSIPEISEIAFGKIGKRFTLVLNFLIMLGFTCIDLILAGINLNSFSIYFGFHMDLKYWILISGVVVLIPYIIFKTLKDVAIISLFGTLATLVVVIVVIVMGLIDLNEHSVVVHHPIVWSGLPLSISTISLAYGASVVYPHVEASMKNPKDWSKILAISFATTCFFYLFVSIVGYLVYGQSVGSPILESIPKGIPWIISILLITIHVILAAPIYLCSFSIELEKVLNINENNLGKTKSVAFRIITRIVTVGVLVVISMYIPFFNDFMSLVGALGNGFIVFIIPVACHLKIFGFKGRPIYEYIWLAIIFALGLVCVILGTIYSIMEIVGDFRNK